MGEYALLVGFMVYNLVAKHIGLCSSWMDGMDYRKGKIVNWEKYLPVLIVMLATVIGGLILLAIAAALFSFFMDNFFVLIVLAVITLAAFVVAGYWFLESD